MSLLERPRVHGALAPAVIIVLAGIALASPPASAPLATLVRLSSWMLVMVIPGIAVHRLVTRRPGGLGEAVLAGFIVSPVVLAVFGVLALTLGASPAAAAHACVVLAAGVALAATAVQRVPFTRPPRRETLVFVAFVAALVLLTAFLPFTREWWRVRSDAWFHAAVVAQIEHTGVPPEDPYFAGVQLQYMWFYHVLVLLLARTLDLDSFWCMAMVNVHALVGLSLAVFCLAGVFRDRFADRLAATATVLLAFNAAFWVFFPVKALKAFIGDVRGSRGNRAHLCAYAAPLPDCLSFSRDVLQPRVLPGQVHGGDGIRTRARMDDRRVGIGVPLHGNASARSSLRVRGRVGRNARVS